MFSQHFSYNKHYGDFFRFDALSHRSSGTSLNVSENLGVVSKTSTPLSGSLENLGGGELLRKNFGANSTSSQRYVLIPVLPTVVFLGASLLWFSAFLAVFAGVSSPLCQ